MTKPFGFYTSYTPGDNSFLESLQKTYGDDFCKISKSDKLALISAIAAQLCSELPTSTFTSVNDLADLNNQIAKNLSISDRAGLIECMIGQIRWGQDLVVAEGETPMQ